MMHLPSAKEKGRNRISARIRGKAGFPLRTKVDFERHFGLRWSLES